MKNFKIIVTDTVTSLISAVIKGETEKEIAVRKLGIYSVLSTLADSGKKKAKDELKKLGIIRDAYAPGSEVVFDSPAYVMTAVTSNPSSRLDAAALSAALAKEGLSQAMQRRIITASTIENKAATSFKVEAK